MNFYEEPEHEIVFVIEAESVCFEKNVSDVNSSLVRNRTKTKRARGVLEVVLVPKRVLRAYVLGEHSFNFFLLGFLLRNNGSWAK